jgi:hypothetical protein
MLLGSQVLYERNYKIKSRNIVQELKQNDDRNILLTGIIDSGTTCLIFPTRIGSKKIYTSE